MKSSKRSYYIKYSVLFAICFAVIFSYFFFTNRTFIKLGGDAEYQHYKALVYYSKYIREIFATLFAEHRIVIPKYSFTLGEGADILQTLHSDVYGDPIAFMSFLVPEKYIYLYYEFSIALRIYLAGLFFSWLCFYTGQKNTYGILAGSMVYDFCYWSIFGLRQHIYFLTPFMYLPLIILGVEHVLKKEKGYILSIAVFLAAVSQFYFFFMEAVLTALYTVIRLLCAYKKNFKKIITEILRIFVHAFLGVMMAAIIVAPMAYAYISDSRMGVENPLNILFPIFYYERLFTIFLSNDFTYDLCMGFAGPCLFALSMSLKKIKRSPLFFVLNIIVFLFLVFPVFGFALNGFAYVTQRWSFGIALLVASELSYYWDDLQAESKYLLIIYILCLGLSIITPWSRSAWVFVPMLFCGLFYCVTVFVPSKNSYKQIVLIALLVLNILYVVDYDLSDRGSGRINSAMSIEKTQDLLTQSDASIYKELDSNGFTRYSGYLLDINSAMLENAKSTDFYWSITNSSVMNYRKTLGLNDQLSWMIRGYDERSALYSLANVKYYICNEGYNGVIPYGFTFASTEQNYKIFENTNYIPFGYTYTKTISEDDWKKMNMLQKQEAMLQGIVMEGISTDANFDFHDFLPVQELIVNENADISEGTVHVSDSKGCIKIVFDAQEGQEVYLSIQDLFFEDTEKIIENDQTVLTIKTEFEANEKTIGYFSQENRYYYDKGDYLLYLGTSKGGKEEVKLTFTYPGNYQYSTISVLTESTEFYKKEVEKLSENHIENLVMKTDSISGDIALDEPKYLLMSIPYSKGWSAFVNGEKTDLLKANSCYMAIQLNEGNHHIELKYETPLYKTGLIVSGAAILIFAAEIILDRKKEER